MSNAHVQQLVCALQKLELKRARSRADLLQACRVEDFTSSSMRISITLEQYQLPPALHRLVPQFQVKRIQY